MFSLIKLSKLLSFGQYYNIAAIVLGHKYNNFGPMIKIYGESEVVPLLKKVDSFIEACTSLKALSCMPIALSKDSNLIIKNHYKVAAAFLAGYEEIGFAYKTIPCEVQEFDYSLLDDNDISDLEFVLDEFHNAYANGGG